MIEGRVVIVTGGAGLIGRALCRGVVAGGGIAVIADVDIAAAERAATALGRGQAFAVALDITSGPSVTALIEKVRGQHGRIDGLVNNAYPRNPAYGRAVDKVTYQDFCENLDGHLGGYFLMMQQMAIDFAHHGGGSIVNMGSVYGVVAPRFDVYEGTSMTMPVEYAAIKSGVIHLTRYFAKYYRRDGVRVNCVSPGGIFDNQPASFVDRYRAAAGTKGMLAPDDIVGAVLFMLSDHARYVTGQNLVVDDGFTL